MDVEHTCIIDISGILLLPTKYIGLPNLIAYYSLMNYIILPNLQLWYSSTMYWWEPKERCHGYAIKLLKRIENQR